MFKYHKRIISFVGKVALKQVIGRQFIVVAIWQLVGHGSLNVIDREVIVNDQAILVVDGMDAARFELWKNAIRLLGRPLLSDGQSQLVQVQVQVQVQLLENIFHDLVSKTFTYATIELGLVTLDTIVRDVNTLHWRSMVIGQGVFIQVPIVDGSPPVSEVEIELLKASIFVRQTSIVSNVTGQVHDGVAERIVWSRASKHLPDFVNRHHWSKRRKVRHGFCTIFHFF